MSEARTAQRLLAEGLGTAALLAVVVGSGVMAQQLAGGNVAVALLANTSATVLGLWVLIELLGPISGAHFNPAVTLTLAALRRFDGPVWGYVAAQLAGAALGVWLVHAMFELPIWQLSAKARWGLGAGISEFVATACLLAVVLRAPATKAPGLVAATVGAGYWFTASTFFANPAAVFGRMFSDSFAGIAPASAPGFVAAQLLGVATVVAVVRALTRSRAGAPG
ncbi:glycerol uptake facilitator-like aquaporin [Inhella inkyongensis]|uniref:Glycerol uptake facilitator-like aquaporin n=1 Tax=Inhella inkyongensis TaxID=392593 RepID=A0A840S5T7_9BURK|nr:aquaporin [Inhella inkyongensis]MBB5205063.1 glycerol uptake facilitator-like aquaporin [Inhella inkyongensis]